ncbi:MAG: PepSY domain-containing protein [Brachybacterium sp.]|uniref:PepSY-associated TM helix domain-containing protein n=1 Tax=Brachybacterium sp. TaxID=1891286 RepID=UPI002649F246|nr:PepSY-associated TM helix domain-containing protein [Brachybacterium sp.]MDN5688090.1 PepSY domain-containing protein [Brachybacterium sp.]
MTTTTRPRQGWFGQLLLRLHFYAAIFVGPFILVSAASGALYAMTPQLEQIVHAEELTAPSDGPALPLADQVGAATAHVGDGAELAAVRPAPEPGETTRVMFAEDSLGESETRAIFVDPASTEIRGDLTVYGTSGALPLRTWLDQLHRSLHLGDVGRLYSELSASWLGVIAAAGLGLWIRRARRARRARDLVRPDLRARGYRRTLSLHTSAGVWVLFGALFLSATGITWSQYGGGNIGTIREAFGFTTASVSTRLPTSPGTTDGGHGGEHAGHGDGGQVAEGSGGHDAMQPAGSTPTEIDGVLAAGRAVNIDTGLVEILPPADADSAWVVQEIQRSYPTEVDAVAVDGATLEVVDRADFADQDLAAKLTRWGIDLHMGTLFGLANQIVLVVIASTLVAMILWGYLMWWQRRPTRGGRRTGRPPRRGALTRAPWWGVVLVLLGAVGIGLMLPLMGASLAAFVVLDTVHGRLTARRPR